MGIFDEFDASVNMDELANATKKARENSKEFDDLPAGKYTVKIEKLEMKMSKTNKPMMCVQAAVTEGKMKKRKMFMNRVLASDKGADKTGNLIAGAETWLSKLQAEDEDGELIRCDFKSYGQFAELIEDIADAIEDMEMEYEVTYDKDAFNPITIDKVAN